MTLRSPCRCCSLPPGLCNRTVPTQRWVRVKLSLPCCQPTLLLTRTVHLPTSLWLGTLATLIMLATLILLATLAPPLLLCLVWLTRLLLLKSPQLSKYKAFCEDRAFPFGSPASRSSTQYGL